MRKFPPYGRRLREQIQKGLQLSNDLYVLIGHRAFEAAKAFTTSQIVLALPPHDSPYSYEWPVADMSVLLINTGEASEDLVRKTAHALLSAKAKIVRAIDTNNGSLTVFRR